MKTCSNCKTQNKDSANYCRFCGTVFPDAKTGKDGITNSATRIISDLQNSIKICQNELTKAKKERDGTLVKMSELSAKYNTLIIKMLRKEELISSKEKEIEELKKKNVSLYEKGNIFQIICLIVILGLSLILWGQCNSINDSKNQMYSSSLKTTEEQIASHQIRINTLINEKEKLKNEKENLLSDYNSLKQVKEELVDLLKATNGNNSLFIKSIEVRNGNEPYGGKIYSRNTTYFYPKIELYSLIEGQFNIFTKIIDPYGLSSGEGSPKGYSFKDRIYISKNRMNTIELSGWGNDKKGHWISGKYRFEFYCNGKLIGSKQITIY